MNLLNNMDLSLWIQKSNYNRPLMTIKMVKMDSKMQINGNQKLKVWWRERRLNSSDFLMILIDLQINYSILLLLW